MKTHNIGQRMTNGGLILASMGILTAIIGNRVRINAWDERVILGGDKLEKKFKETYRSILKEGPDKGSSFFARLAFPLMEKSTFRFERKISIKELKVKTWFEENKDKIYAEARCISWYAFGFGLAWFVNGKLTEYRCALGIANLYQKGLMKFCDPATGMEITIDKAVEISKKMRN